LTLDTLAPVIALSQPDDTRLSASELYNWYTALSVSDAGSGVQSMGLKVLQGSTEVLTDLSIRTDAGGQAVRVRGDLDALGDGDYTLQISAQDAAGNASTAELTLHVDRTAPTLSLNTAPASLQLRQGQTATLDLVLSEAAQALPTITPSAGSLSAWQAVNADADNAHPTHYQAVWTPPAGAKATLSWTVGPWRDLAGNDGRTDGTPAPIAYDTQPPTVLALAVQGDAADHRFKAGQAIDTHVQFSEAVFVSGVPSLALDVGGQSRTASYVGLQSGRSDTLVFRYTVQATDTLQDTDTDGISLPANALSLAAGEAAIRDALGNAAVLNHSAVAANADALVDTTAPTLSLSLQGSDTLLAAGQSATLVLDFSEQPAALPSVGVTCGSLSAWSRVSDTQYTAVFTPAPALASGQVSFSLGAWSDLAGNAGTQQAGAALPVLRVDTVAPTVTDVSDTTSALVTNQTIEFVVSFSEALEAPLDASDFSANGGQLQSVELLPGSGAQGNSYRVRVTPDAGVQGQSVS
jgi:hypothetical protein